MTFVVSHQPAVVIPFGAPDYLAHFINYGVQSVLLIWALSGGKWRAIAPPVFPAAVVVTILLGIADEFHQSFIPGRDAGLRDVVADAAGAVAGACLVAAIAAFGGSARRPT